MPTRAKRPCTQLGCPALVDRGRCEAHTREDRRRAEAQRDPATRQLYDAWWRQARVAYLREHPLCECNECEALGRVLPSTVVDHVKPHRGNPQLFRDRNNWQAMAKVCHDRKTAREDGGFGNRRSA